MACRLAGANIWTNAGILLIRTLGTNFSGILSEIRALSFKKIELKMSSAKWRPFCLGMNELKSDSLLLAVTLADTLCVSNYNTNSTSIGNGQFHFFILQYA